MIKLSSNLPDLDVKSVEYTRIKCLEDCYGEDNNVLFWVQDDEKSVISLADGNMTIYNSSANIIELAEFVNMISPNSIFSDYNTLKKLGIKAEALSVMYCYCNNKGSTFCEKFSSRELYDLLKCKDFDMPQYPYFAVDFCRRFNHGKAQYYAVSDVSAAVSFNTDKYAVLSGITSCKKGMGSVTLDFIKKMNYGRGLFACCRQNINKFYEKNGFQKLYNAGYWVKNNEH